MKTSSEFLEEGLPLAKPAASTPVRRMAAELDGAGLDRMKRQLEFLQPSLHRVPEAPGVGLMLGLYPYRRVC